MKTRFYAQRNVDSTGWMVLDRRTGAPAETAGHPHDDVDDEDVDELVEMLNDVEQRQRAAARKPGRLSLKIRRDRYYSGRDPEGDGWAVFDTATGALASVRGSSSSGLTSEDADELADILNQIEAEKV